MGFLDNSGDIILDAVLTDTGRKRLAQGDGSFKITKFALGDDEIDYGLYDSNNPSGSAYYDLEILQLPVLEAFTNNTSLMKSKLITIPRTNLLYLPVIERNTQAGLKNAQTSLETILVAATTATKEALATLKNDDKIIDGFLRANGSSAPNPIMADQGINNAALSGQALSSDLIETQYMIEIDNRLGQITNGTQQSSDLVQATPSFIDDDNVAAYYLSLGTDTTSGFVATISSTDNDESNNSPIAGAPGTRLSFGIKPSLDLNNTGNFLFTRLGSVFTITGDTSGNTYYYIDTNVRVSGVTTGYRIDIPVRFVKLVS